MSRLVFHPPAVQPSGAQVRIDTASGSDTPATGLLSMDGSPIPATLAADGVTGAVPAFQGPADGTTTLYLKTLDEAHAAVVATVAVTGTSAGTPVAPTGTSSAFAGTTIGTSEMVGSEIVVTYSSVWGINGAGEAYYDADGAAAGEAAVLMIDPTTGAVVVTKPEGANAP